MGEPYSKRSDPLCKRQNRAFEEILGILMNQEHAKQCMCLLPCAVLTIPSSRRLPYSVERIKENEEKETPKRKNKAEIAFCELKTPPGNLVPLFGEVSRKIWTHSPR